MFSDISRRALALVFGLVSSGDPRELGRPEAGAIPLKAPKRLIALGIDFRSGSFARSSELDRLILEIDDPGGCPPSRRNSQGLAENERRWSLDLRRE